MEVIVPFPADRRFYPKVDSGATGERYDRSKAETLLTGKARAANHHLKGRMFWFIWKKLFGSYFVLISCRRR